MNNPKMALSDSQIDAILAAVRAQVEWNGWEEPHVRNRFRQAFREITKGQK